MNGMIIGRRRILTMRKNSKDDFKVKIIIWTGAIAVFCLWIYGMSGGALNTSIKTVLVWLQ